ncbi:hypothetical protein K431DRAFT_317246 [Polychaeton citri CBS 116435]|uniref:Glycosylphosphatidylinositol anchor biosynthesis protein 11 n=1 Tax=Polychaeton citri CBS 116435 TaxID=1314669 RepID=A0A9P4QGE7_9PEZI|nr:hypothetical protein K431DRAFT_317246 [Polychaeton citri CBS 116435]
MSLENPVMSIKSPSGLAHSKPIDALPGQFSSVYGNLHPILLLSTAAVSFPTLVKDPVSTLLGLVPTTATFQVLYCILCLPSTGQAPPPALKPGQKKKSGKVTQDFGAKLVPAFLSLVLSITLTAPVLFVFTILFGAPVTSHTLHTLLFALHIALLTTPQLFYAHGLDTQKWLRIVSLQLPIDEAYGMAIGAFIGAWLGAIPIPLDWDRDWQRWPVTITVGLYCGAVLGKLAGGYLLKGSRIKIS